MTKRLVAEAAETGAAIDPELSFIDRYDLDGAPTAIDAAAACAAAL